MGTRTQWPCARTERGAAAVEFGLILPVLLLLVFGTIQYGLYFWAMQGGSDIARDAVRRAAVGEHADCDAFIDAVEAQVAALAGTSAVDVSRTYTPASSPDPTVGQVDINDSVTVTVAFRSVDLNMPFIPLIDDARVTSTAEARVEYVPEQPEACP